MVQNRFPSRPSHYQLAEQFLKDFNGNPGNAPLRWCNDEWHYGDDPWLEDVVRADLWRYLDGRGYRPTSKTIDSVLDALRAASINAELDVEFPA